MKIYSENIHIFTLKCENLLKNIILKETPFKLRRTRFEHRGFTYPIHIVVFDSKSSLGYFDPHTYQIGLNLSLIYQAKENVLIDILRHEFAHYIQFIETKVIHLPHGDEFKSICHRFGWDRSISKAHINIEEANDVKVGNLASEKLIKKIKALLNLANSENQHEAELATLKANQLLLKHNIQYYELLTQNEYLYADTVIKAKRKSAKLNCIYEILKSFMLRPIFVYGQGQVELEVCGSLENIELAHYITDFLDNELEKMFKEQKHLKGLKAKNSFFTGVAKGYLDKMQNIKKDLSSSEINALVKLDKKLDENLNKIYRRISHSSQSNTLDPGAFNNGKTAGNTLVIQQGLKNKSKTKLALPWRSK